jgi:hypothetical protein
MPNWCYNRMNVTGDRESLVKLTEAITRKHDPSLAETTMGVEQVDYDLSVLFPVPEELRISAMFFNTETDDPEYQELLKKYEANKAKYGHTTWYDWCLENWSTKWSPRIEEWTINDYPNGSEIYAYYETAWSPADGLICEVSKQFPTLLFTVSSDEEGRSFSCVSAFSKGEMVAEAGCELSANKVPEQFREAYARIDNEIENGTSDEGYDAWDEMSELDSDVLGWLETQVNEKLVELGLLPKVGV